MNFYVLVITVFNEKKNKKYDYGYSVIFPSRPVPVTSFVVVYLP